MRMIKWQGNKREWKGVLFILPSLIGTGMFMIAPFVDVIRRSFSEAVSNKFVGFSNYVTIFQNKAYQLAVSNTFKFMAIGIPLLFVISLAVAVLLIEQEKLSHYFKSIFLHPMAVPVASIAFAWQLFFQKQGLVNGLLNKMNFSSIDWINGGKVFGILIVSYIWKNLGYNVILWSAGLTSIPTSYYEAAKVDGASNWQCFVKITLPNLMPSMYTIVILSLLNAFKVFREAYLVAGNYPNDSIYMLQHLMNNWFRDLSLDKMSAAAVVNAVMIIIFMIFLKRIWTIKE